jgi:hypothetical protein
VIDPVPGAILKKFEVRLKIILTKINKSDSAGLKVLWRPGVVLDHIARMTCVEKIVEILFLVRKKALRAEMIQLKILYSRCQPLSDQAISTPVTKIATHIVAECLISSGHSRRGLRS